jgi:NAD(P)H-hydrate epimerase
MADLDRKLTEDYHIELPMMMENAGRALAVQASRLAGGSALNKRVLVMAGKGNNGGGGLVAARHLHNWGARVEVALASSVYELKDVPSKQLLILHSMNIPILEASAEVKANDFDLIVDALLGYNQKGDPRGRIAQLVRMANDSGKPILALDIPTGLDPHDGSPHEPCVKATQTLTLALPKSGLLKKEARTYVGRLFLADISVPRELYLKLGIDKAPQFDAQGIIEIA